MSDYYPESGRANGPSKNPGPGPYAAVPRAIRLARATASQAKNARATALRDKKLRLGDVADAAKMSKSLYTSLETGDRAATRTAIDQLVAAYGGNVAGQTAIRLATGVHAGGKDVLPLRFKELEPLEKWEALRFGRDAARFYDEGDIRAARALAEATVERIPANAEYSRELMTAASILTRAYSHLGEFESAKRVTEGLIEATLGKDPELLAYGANSRVAIRQQMRKPADLTRTIREYDEVLERFVNPYLSADPRLMWARAENRSLKEQMMAVFAALERYRNPELVDLMLSLRPRLAASAERVQGYSDWMLSNRILAARIDAYIEPQKALEDLKELAARTDRMPDHVSMEVTRLVARETLGDTSAIIGQARVVGALGRISPGVVRSRRLIMLQRSALMRLGYSAKSADLDRDPLDWDEKTGWRA